MMLQRHSSAPQVPHAMQQCGIALAGLGLQNWCSASLRRVLLRMAGSLLWPPRLASHLGCDLQWKEWKQQQTSSLQSMCITHHAVSRHFDEQAS
jgi:hypothetical protein